MDLFVAAIGFGLVTASLLALAGVGFTLQFGIAGFFNLTYGSVMTAAAFGAYYLNQLGLSVWGCLVAAALFGGILSVGLNQFIFAPFLRRGIGLFGMVIVTLAVGLLIQNVLLAVGGISFFSYSNVPTDVAVHAMGMIFTTSQVVIIALASASMVGMHFLLTASKLGKAMRATASDPVLARASGINTARVINVSWVISGALCGMAGVGLAINIGTFQSTTGDGFLPTAVAAAMLGGVGQPYGAMLGAVIVGLGTEVSATYIDPVYKTILALAIIVIVILIRPQGLLGSLAGREGSS